jgi:hypothetical protein
LHDLVAVELVGVPLGEPVGAGDPLVGVVERLELALALEVAFEVRRCAGGRRCTPGVRSRP